MVSFALTRIKDVLVGCTIEDGKAADIRCYEDSSLIGNVYVARVSNILNNINAAFVDISRDTSCYLPLEDYKQEKPLKTGDELIVQVSKDGVKSKQPSVTTNISLNGEYIIAQAEPTIGISSKLKGEAGRKNIKKLATSVLDELYETLGVRYGVIVRTKAEELICGEGYEDIIRNDIIKTVRMLDDIINKAKFLKLYSTVSVSEPSYIKDIAGMKNIDIITDERDVYDTILSYMHQSDASCCCSNITSLKLYDETPPLSSLYNINSTIEKCLGKRAYLKSGGYLVIEPTEAMTVVDVNSGKAVKNKNTEEEYFRINVEAAYELARQLKLRNISGIIIVDFINMKSKENQDKLMDEIKKAVASDYIKVNVVDYTKLGLVELTRMKVRKPLHEIFLY